MSRPSAGPSTTIFSAGNSPRSASPSATVATHSALAPAPSAAAETSTAPWPYPFAFTTAQRSEPSSAPSNVRVFRRTAPRSIVISDRCIAAKVTCELRHVAPPQLVGATLDPLGEGTLAARFLVGREEPVSQAGELLRREQHVTGGEIETAGEREDRPRWRCDDPGTRADSATQQPHDV